jgi:hypothetical protein
VKEFPAPCYVLRCNPYPDVEVCLTISVKSKRPMKRFSGRKLAAALVAAKLAVTVLKP